jgi:hypothetical protein
MNDLAGWVNVTEVDSAWESARPKADQRVSLSARAKADLPAPPSNT